MSRLVPSPLLSAALFLLWLALAGSTSAGQIVLGIAIALAAPLLSARFRTPRDRLRRPWVALRFVLAVSRDAVASSFEVAWGVVRWRWRRPRAAFVTIPLELRDPRGLAALAMVTTVVPGTVWSELALDRHAVLLHVWDVVDEASFVARYKERYERPLREIFE